MKKQLLIGALAFSFMANAQTLIESYDLDYGSSKGVNGTNGKYLGWATADKNSQSNGAVKFNGENQLSLGNPTIDATNGFSISFWYKPSSAMTGDITHHVLSKRAVCNVGNQLNISANPSNNSISISIRVDAPSPAFTASATLTATPNEWQHITFVLDNTARRVLAYKNGTLSSFLAYTGTTGVIKEFSPTSNLILGSSICAGADGSLKFKGELDEVKLFASALTGPQVSTIYNEVLEVPVNPNTSLADLLVYEDKMEITCSKTSRSSVLIGATATPNRNGNVNSAIQFNGTSSAADAKRVTSENPLGNLTANYSSLAVSSWIKLTGNEANGFITANYAGTNICGNNGAQKGFVFRIVANKLNAYVTVGTASYQVSTTSTLPLNQWHHVAVNYTQPLQSINDFEFYIDGIKVAHAVEAGNIAIPALGSFIAPGVSPTSFGGSLNTSNGICVADYSLNGALDDLKIYKAKLTQAQITQLASEGTSAFVAPLGDVKSDLVLAETFNTFADSLAFATKYAGKYTGVKFVNDRFGNPKSAMDFNSYNAYVNAGVNLSDVFADGDGFTYSVWLKPSDLMSNNMIIGHSGDSGCEDQRQQYFRIFDGKVNFTASFSNASLNYRNVTGGTLLLPGSWYHVVVMVNQPIMSSDDIEIWINGVKETLTTVTGGTSTGNLPTNTSKLGFGNYLSTSGVPCYQGADASFKGAIDDIRIFDRFLCLADLQTLYTEADPVLTSLKPTKSISKTSVLYPNPVTGNTLNITSTGNWTISNTVGELLLNGSEQAVDVSTLSSGMYILSIDTENGRVTNSFLKH